MPRKGRTSRSVRVLKRKVVYDGRVVRLDVDRVLEPGGLEATREVVRHPGSVVVLAMFSDGRVLLVRQFRYAARRNLWELVAGGLEPGESIVQAAQRELLEETGYRARRVKRLMSFFPSPGILDERMHVVAATGLTQGKPHPETDERIQAGIFTRDKIRAMLRAQKIQDGKTLVGLSWWLLSKAARV